MSVAQLPEPPAGQDRVFTTLDAVIVLDGASAFGPVEVDAATYAEHLGASITNQLHDQADADLPYVVAAAIASTRDVLDLAPGKSPSSTISIVRVFGDRLDVLALGDSPVLLGRTDATVERICDDRLAKLPNNARTLYRKRLADGHGYDDEHRALLREVQTVQRTQRNQPGGYWIAEAEPDAARHTLTRSYDRGEVEWCILATDGAADPIDHLGLANWRALAHAPSRLRELLHRCTDWEAHDDPDGCQLPRAKRHDDKTIAAVTGVRDR